MKRVRTGKLRKVDTGERHESNGKPVMGVPVEDLSEEARERYWREVAEEQGRQLVDRADGSDENGAAARRRTPKTAERQAAPARHAQEARTGVPITADGVPDEGAMRAWGYDEQAETYARRMRAVSRLESLLDRAEYGEICETRQRVANEYNVSARTLKRWKDRKDEWGPAGLVPGPGRDRGQYRKIPDEMGRAIRDFYLQQNRPTAAQVYRQVVLPYCQRGGLVAPHVSTVRRYLRREVWPVEETAMREGEHEWRAYIHPKAKRRYPEVNECWVADHRKLDTFVLHRGKAIRPWVTAIVDWGSAAWVSWRISPRPSADTVAHALRGALLQVGPPDAFYRDNGKEFVAKRLGGKPERLRDPGSKDVEEAGRWPAAMPPDVVRSSIWDALGIELITALPYRSWSKQIEPMFNSYASRYENLIPGWCGRNAENKPANLSDLKESEQLLTLGQFGEVFARVARRLNTERPVGERDRPPLAYYEEHEADPPDPQTVSVLLQDIREEKVDTQGIEIQHRKTQFRFYSPEIAEYVGLRLTVAWDPAEPSSIIAYAPDGRVLAVPRARDADPLSYGEANKEVQRGGKVQKRRLSEIQGEIRGAARVEAKDPTGAFRMIQARKQQDDAAADRGTPKPEEQDSVEGASDARLPEARKEAERQREAREQAEEEQERRRTGTDDERERNRYSDIVDLI